MQTKKSYDSPKVTFYGNVEQITFGPGGGFADNFFGIGDGDGGFRSCNRNPGLNGCGS